MSRLFWVMYFSYIMGVLVGNIGHWQVAFIGGSIIGITPLFLQKWIKTV